MADSQDSAGLNAEIERLTRELQSANDSLQNQAATTETTASTSSPAEGWWSTTNAMTISATVLAFGIMVIMTIAYLIQRGRNPEELLKIFGTTLIVVMAVFLVVAGYSDQQISPVMGLMGTIAGYLLGRNAQGNEPAKKD